MRAFLERLYLPTDRDTTAYLQIDLIADADSAAEHRRAPVNAVLILDRSGSMSGVKMDRAREAARALVRALLPEDRLAIVEFSSGASVVLHSTPLTPQARSRAMEAIEELQPSGGTNMSAAFAAAGPELRLGRGRVDKVFLAKASPMRPGCSGWRAATSKAPRSRRSESATTTTKISSRRSLRRPVAARGTSTLRRSCPEHSARSSAGRLRWSRATSACG